MTEARPEPVRDAATAAAAITTVVGLLLTLSVVFHWITPDDSAVLGPALGSAIPTVVGAVSTIVAALRARRQVTPLSDPRDDEGSPLVVEIPGRGQTPGVADHAAPEE